MPRLGAPIDPAAAEQLAGIRKRIDRHRAQLADLEVERDAVIVAQGAAGVPLRQIAEHAGITYARVKQILDRQP